MTNSNPGIFVCKKKAIDIIAGMESYRNLSTFEDVNQLNDTCRYYREVFADKLNKTQLAVLNYLQGYSSNSKKGTTGVSWRTKREIGKDLGKTRETISRICKYLESLGIIRQYATRRKNGDKRQTSDAIVIQPLPAEIKDTKNKNVTQEKSENLDISTIQKKEMSHQKNKFYSLKQKIKTYNKRKAVSNSHNHLNLSKKLSKDVPLDSTFTASYVPNAFVQAVKPFFDEAAVIEDFWKSVYLDTKAISNIIAPETITYTAINAFRQSIRGYKQGKIRTSLVRYFTGTFKKLMDQAYSEMPIEDFSTGN